MKNQYFENIQIKKKMWSMWSSKWTQLWQYWIIWFICIPEYCLDHILSKNNEHLTVKSCSSSRVCVSGTHKIPQKNEQRSKEKARFSHYSKSHVQKFNFDKNPNIFTSFSPKKSTIFSGNQSWIFGQKIKIWNSVIV